MKKAPKTKTPASETKLAPMVVGSNTGLLGNARFWSTLILVLCCVLYANTLQHGFVLDDAGVVSENKLVQQGISGIPKLISNTLFYGLEGVNKETWRPLTMTLYALEVECFGLSPFHFHLLNVLLYGLCVVLLFDVLLLLTRRQLLPAVAISLLFATHPLHTEVVANIKSRDEILSLMFMLVSTRLCISYLTNSKIYKLVSASFFFLAGCFSKESAITFVLLCPLLLYFFSQSDFKKLVIIFIVLFVSSLLYLVVRYITLDAIAATSVISEADNMLVSKDFYTRLATSSVVLVKEIALLFFPHPLVYDYTLRQIPVYSLSDATAILSLLLVLALFILSLAGAKSKNLVACGSLFFLISISVVSNIFFLIGNNMAERLLFIPSIGFCIAVVYALMRVTGIQGAVQINTIFKQPVFGITLLVLLVGFSYKTIARNPDWKDNYTLFSRDLKNARNSCRAHYNLGSVLWRKAQNETNDTKKKLWLQQAQSELQRAIEIYPQHADAIINLANVHHELGNYDMEMQLLGSISADKNGEALLHFNFANALAAKGDYKTALEQYEKAMASANTPENTYTGAAVVCNELGLYQQAITYCQKELVRKPNSVEAYITLASALIGAGNEDKALSCYEAALKINPSYAEAWINMGNLYANQKEYAKAEKALLKGVALSPNMPEAAFNLAYCYLQQKKYNYAERYFQQALKLRNPYPQSYQNLGYIASVTGKYEEAIALYQKAIEHLPKDKGNYLSIAFCYGKLGNKAAMQEWQNKAARIAH